MTTLLTTYFQDHAYPFTKHHIDSYRELLRRHIPETIASFNPITMVKFDPDDPTKLKIKVEVFVGGIQNNAEEPLKLYMDRPTYLNDRNENVLLTPYEARLKNYSYMSHLLADITVRYTEEGKAPYTKVFPKAWIGEIPIMLHSDLCILHQQSPDILRKLGECIYDQGGYFIIDGKEKVIISQERITTNRLFIEETPKEQNFSHRGHIHCTGERGETVLSPRTITFYLIRRELPVNVGADDVKEEYKNYRGAILVSIPSIQGLIPLFTLFRLLGVETDKAILETLFGTLENIPKAFLNFMIPSIRHATQEDIYDQTKAIAYLTPMTYFKTATQVHAILINDIFPNMNPSDIRLPNADMTETHQYLYENKAKLLGQLVNDFVRSVLNIRALSDRDGYVFKRIDISGFLLAQLFQSAYIQFKNNCRDMLDAHYHYIIKNKGQLEKLITPENIRRFLQPSIMTEIMNRSLKGRWGPKPEDPDQEIIQDLARISYIGFLSHLRRVNLPLDRTIKITSPHRLHSQQWGIMCPFESPDGASVGYLKNFALLSHITFGTDSDILYPCLLDLGMIPLYLVKAGDSHRTTSVYLNGQWVGTHDQPNTFVRRLRLYRRNALLNSFTSIAWDIPRQTIRILTEAGRACRPLAIVEKQKRLLDDGGVSNHWYDWLFGKKWKSVHPSASANPADLYYRSYYIRFAKAFPSSKPMSIEEEMAVLESNQASIEMLDIEEANMCLVAMTPGDIKGLHTHCELHPSTIFSVVTNNIPFSNHNQAPRNIFHGAQSKQAIGIYATNFTKRFDTMAYIQHYPQRPLLTTQNSQYTLNDRMPNGFNVIVAVMTYSGFNQEDGLMINKGSIDRGLFHITAYKSLSVAEEVLNDTEEIIFANPERLLAQMRDGDVETYENAEPVLRNYQPDKTNYSLLDDSGVITEESYIPKGDSVALVGVLKRKKKFVKKQKGLEMETVTVEEYENMSIKSDVHHYGKVDKVYLEKKTAKTPYRICKVRFRKVRKPEFGDKHSSRHGQKGVIGLVVREENMPFTKDGIRPDIIVNPHAFPSRMTIGHLVECVFAKLCCLEGTLGDGSVFVPFRQEVICDRLEDHGFERYGNEILYNGFTGATIPTEIFMGPTFYLRLKHMVADKIHARGAGFVNPHDQLTRQPTGGRSKMGGLRFGEMERDSLLSHGLSQFIKESYMERSDKYRWLVCKHCGGLMDYSQKEGQYKNIACRLCGTTEFNCFETPFAFKLLKQEMEAMGLAMRLSDIPFDIGLEPVEDFLDEISVRPIAKSMEGGAEPPSFKDDVIVDFGGSLDSSVGAEGSSAEDAKPEESTIASQNNILSMDTVANTVGSSAEGDEDASAEGVEPEGSLAEGSLDLSVGSSAEGNEDAKPEDASAEGDEDASAEGDKKPIPSDTDREREIQDPDESLQENEAMGGVKSFEEKRRKYAGGTTKKPQKKEETSTTKIITIQ
jgi:DNA-directed RNA polymerase II subunit RPB2